MRIGFHCDSFSLRGVTVATLSYARLCRKSLNQESIIIKCKNHTPWIKENPEIQAGIKDIPILHYDEPHQLNELLVQNNIDALYILTSGMPENRFSDVKIPLWVHSVFPTKINQINGDKFACVSEWLSNECFNKKIPYVPHIIEPAKRPKIAKENWKQMHQIPQDAVIIGSMGGSHSFDLKPAREGLIQAINASNWLYFVSLNHQPFVEHKQAIFLEGTSNIDVKESFIYSCDAMLHGRAQGETFGLACAEFAEAGKPIFAWRHAPERHHLEQFCNKELLFSTANELATKLLEFSEGDATTSSYEGSCRNFYSAVVAEKFRDVFLSEDDSARRHEFELIDKLQILKRRISRSLRARIGRNFQAKVTRHTEIDPISGFPMES